MFATALLPALTVMAGMSMSVSNTEWFEEG